jgi:hypothetical protein
LGLTLGLSAVLLRHAGAPIGKVVQAGEQKQAKDSGHQGANARKCELE